MTEPDAEVLSRRERLACGPPDPCAYDNTCRNHKFLAELEDMLAGKDRLIRLQAAALDVWKTAHPHEQSPGACARALAEKDAEIESLARHREMLLGDRAKADEALAQLLTWAREARDRLEMQSRNFHHDRSRAAQRRRGNSTVRRVVVDLSEYCEGPWGEFSIADCANTRALLSRAPEGVK